ncbi:cytochrome P450 [Halioglobus maricola]|uniref:Cytochrome P450 n=1 Tax=Halioglobus maricola TaxID=2601894 RepID=A0A5P9NJK6_9GAMM|nr:cytochrome P450 [Halioglobus maricola]QFU75404.1 cytochrome P450 [Halioglobus maricola]
MNIETALANYDLPKIRQYQEKTPRADLAKIPGSRGLPFFGHMFPFLKDFHKLLDQEHARHGPVFKQKSPLGEMVFLLGPEANELVLKNEDKLFSNFLAWDVTFKGLFDNNLLERDFSDHKQKRRILQAAFKREAIVQHLAIMSPVLKAGISQLSSGKTVKAKNFLKDLLLDTGAKVFLGSDIGPEAKNLNQAFEAIVAGTADFFKWEKIWFSPYAKGVKGNQVVSEFIFREIDVRRSSSGGDMFTQFCQLKDDEGRYFSDEEIRDHILFLLFAAHDTTTSTLSSTLYALASNSEWQEELRAEVTAIDKEDLELDDLDLLVKTGWTIAEALRMYPPLAMMPRVALREFEFAGHIFPRNTPVAVSPLFTHYMEEYWEKPHTFDPTRFSPERNEQKGNFFQYIPFGGGAHKCLGLHFAEVQGKTFLYHLLKNYKVSKDEKMDSYKYNNIPLTFPTDGLPLTFTLLQD